MSLSLYKILNKSGNNENDFISTSAPCSIIEYIGANYFTNIVKDSKFSNYKVISTSSSVIPEAYYEDSKLYINGSASTDKASIFLFSYKADQYDQGNFSIGSNTNILPTSVPSEPTYSIMDFDGAKELLSESEAASRKINATNLETDTLSITALGTYDSNAASGLIAENTVKIIKNLTVPKDSFGTITINDADKNIITDANSNTYNATTKTLTFSENETVTLDEWNDSSLFSMQPDGSSYTHFEFYEWVARTSTIDGETTTICSDITSDGLEFEQDSSNHAIRVYVPKIVSSAY